MANLRQALEHVGDAEWLRMHSPLESVMTLVAARKAAPAQHLPSTGIKALDERLKAVWQDWETRPKTGLQSLLWSAVRQIAPVKDANFATLLLLTYFQDPRPKQADLVKELALGQSTYYRQLGAAVQELERVLIAQLQPSLRLESPVVKSLIGREQLLRDCLAALREGGAVSLVGASGLGKTSLGAAICHQWSVVTRQSPVVNPQSPATFWYTFRPGLTDNAQQLIFALALFLHQQGVSNLWMHLIAHLQDVGVSKAMAMVRKSLEDLRAAPPLFCFDEVDLLLPDELDDSDDHAQLRGLLEDFAESPRGGASLLLIGQRLLMEPERGRVFALNRFGIVEVRALLQGAGIELDDASHEAVLNYTRGNPLLLQLLAALHHMGEPILANLSHLASTASLDWFLTRLRRHLSIREQDLVDAICVFDAPAPADLWRKQTKMLDRLIQLSLIDRDASDRVVVPMALREALYRQLPADLRDGLHVSAAQACAERGAFTLAAHHFVLGKQPEMAIWTWHAHRDEEIRQGQAHTALGIFESLRFAPLADEQDRRALSFVLADLCHLLGKPDDGLAALDTVHWQPNRVSSARARELRGALLAMRGDMDAALAEYRASLDALSSLQPTKPVTLRVEYAQQNLWRARDAAVAKREALLAKHDVEIVLGQIELEAGHLEDAVAHFHTALDAGRQINDPVRLAKANEALGILEARRLNVDAASRHLEEAGRYYQSFGNVICAVGVTKTNISYACLLARRYEEAIAPAQEAVAFFKDMQQPYWLSLNEANLAEAYANLGRLQEAEELAWRALAHEEASVRPFCQYVLGHVRRVQHRFDEAERFCKDALASAEANVDSWARGFAWRVLGEVYQDWGRLPDARAAFEAAADVFRQIGSLQEADWVNQRIGELMD